MRAPLRPLPITPFLARRAICVASAVAFAAVALSCAPVLPATRVRVIPPPASSQQLPPGVNEPAPFGAPPAEAQPPLDVATPPPVSGETPSTPGARSAEAADADRVPAPPTSNLIALILPLEVAAYERAASAVRDGFMDGAAAADASGNCVVIAYGPDGVISAFEAARAKGVRVAVGPLVRDDLKTLAISHADLPWTLALNQLDDGSRLPSAIYSFPLSVESDGRMLADRAHARGAHSVDVIEGDSPLMKRMAGAFAMRWTETGGAPPLAFRFDAAPEALSGLRRTITRSTPDAVVLAVNGDHAALLKPFIGGVDAYASGLVFERPSPAVAHDLDGVRVVEIPYLLTPEAPEFAPFRRRSFDSASLARLYALGLDAFRIAASFRDGPPGEFELDGATGHVTLTAGRLFAREGRLAVYRDGQLVPVENAP